ncbi:hypothetical protein T492DRAFT_1002438, partial [Pavlovales sp. CCMP2436]
RLLTNARIPHPPRARARPATRTPRVLRTLKASRLGSLSVEAGPLANTWAQSRGDLREHKRSPRVRRAHGSSCLVGRARARGQDVRTRRTDAGRTHVLQRTADSSRAPHRVIAKRERGHRSGELRIF